MSQINYEDGFAAGLADFDRTERMTPALFRKKIAAAYRAVSSARSGRIPQWFVEAYTDGRETAVMHDEDF